jgi:hypothetical protein
MFSLVDDCGTQLAEIERWNSDPEAPDVAEQAEANAQLIRTSPEMLSVLELALAALNEAPRFRIRGLDLDSYGIASRCDRVIAKAKGKPLPLLPDHS